RKKRQFSFLKDEVKVQYQGLFPYFSEHLFHMKHIPFDKVTMQQMAGLIPELTFFFRLQQNDTLIHIGSIHECSLKFPIHILDNYYLTANSFIKRIKSHASVLTSEIGEKQIIISLRSPIKTSFGPFFVDYHNNEIYFPLYRDQFILISEVMVHYLILYNLSMLSRYESQWWGELLTLKPDKEYPVIAHFLETTADKVPLLLGKMLYEFTLST